MWFDRNHMLFRRYRYQWTYHRLIYLLFLVQVLCFMSEPNTWRRSPIRLIVIAIRRLTSWSLSAQCWVLSSAAKMEPGYLKMKHVFQFVVYTLYPRLLFLCLCLFLCARAFEALLICRHVTWALVYLYTPHTLTWFVTPWTSCHGHLARPLPYEGNMFHGIPRRLEFWQITVLSHDLKLWKRLAKHVGQKDVEARMQKTIELSWSVKILTQQCPPKQTRGVTMKQTDWLTDAHAGSIRQATSTISRTRDNWTQKRYTTD